MKIKILALLGVGTLAYASANLTFTQTDAALTAPTNYHYSYRQSNVDIVSGNNWAIRNNGGSTLSHVPTYTQTYDGQYYDYVHSGYEIVSGLTVSHTFNNSNTSWSQVSGNTYRPNNAAAYIGSATGNGTTINKLYVKFNNQTNKDYLLYFDASSSASNGLSWDVYLNNKQIFTWSGLGTALGVSTALIQMYLPSFSEIYISNPSSSVTYYFDAWYLQDLGVSSSWTNGNSEGYTEGYNDGELDGYTQGYDEGYDYGVNNPPMTSLFTTAFNSISSIFNIALFGGLTLGTVIVAPIAVSLLWFILGIVSGVGGKKQ